jgi:hypothetical protein
MLVFQDSDMEKTMNRDVVLWLYHSKAVIVIVTDEGEEIKIIELNMEKHVRYSSDSSQPGQFEDVRDRQFMNHLNGYYDDVIAYIGEAKSIQVFGHSKAKGELEKHLERQERKGVIVALKPLTV